MTDDGARRAAEARRILEERARALARPLADRAGVDAPQEAPPVLLVRVEQARYAVPAAAVEEVVRADRLTPLPGADPPAVAVLAWRGRMLVVRDLRPGAGGLTREPDALARVVVVREGRAAVGLLVDAVEDVRPLDAATIHPRAGAGDVGGHAASRHPAGGRVAVAGVTADAVAVLDVAALVAQTP